MLQTFAKIFPLFDHTYILQLYEYQLTDFLKWFFKYPFKRNLQRKHHLEFTNKAVLILALSLCLIILGSILAGLLFNSIFLGLLFLLLFPALSPFVISLSLLIVWPFDYYKKTQILAKAKAKLNTLPNLKVVAITGSFAKTSTKDILYTLLWKKYRVVKTPKSFNTSVSIARTILSDLKDNTEIFIVEMDAYHPGEIDQLSRLIRPDLALITAIAPQHLSRFGGNMDSLAKTQFEIAGNLKTDGILFLNSDDDWTKKLEGNYSVKKVFFSGVGIQMNINAASAIAKQLGLDDKTIQERLKLVQPTEHRMEVKQLHPNLTMIDNSYNTNPKAAEASLKLLDSFKYKQKIIITPGLIELGSMESQENQELAQKAAKVADQIIIVGQNAKKDLALGLKTADYPKSQTYFVNSTVDGMTLVNKLMTKPTVMLIENDLPDQYF